jgi:uncharacterized protein YjbI with pentapeptide repeats
MANEEHLKILKQGIEKWNNWREENPEIIPDLSGISLADFHHLVIVNQSPNAVNFTRGNFSKVNLSGVDFRMISRRGCYSAHVSFIEADLSEAKLQGAKLHDAVLRGANLIAAELIRADLRRAKLQGANLSRADLSDARLPNAYLTGAILTGACVDGWRIEGANLDDIECDYVYLAAKDLTDYPRYYPPPPHLHRQPRFTRRCPSNRNFALGEFTKLFRKALDTVNLIFSNGFDWDAFAYSYKQLQIENEELHLQIKTIDNRDGILVITVQGIPEDYQARWESSFRQKYDLRLQELEARYQGELKAKDGQIVLYERMISQSDRTITRHEKTIDQLIERIDTPLVGDINISGSQNISSAIAQTALSAASKYNLSLDKHMIDNRRAINTGGGNYNERIEGNYVQGNYYAAAQPKSIVETAAEIQQLLEQLDKSYPIDTTTGKMALATEAMSRIESDPSLAERIVSALQAGSIEAIAQLLNHPAASFVIGALEDWKKTKGS